MQSMRSVVRCGAVHTSIGWVQRNGAACGKLGFNNRNKREKEGARRTELITTNNEEYEESEARSKE